MGDFTAKGLSIFLSLAATLYLCVSTPAFADPHDGMSVVPDDIDIPMDSNFEEAEEPRQGGLVGNIPVLKKPDFLLKNLKPKDYPIEFLIPFIKVSQVFEKRIPAKDQPREQSAMQPQRALASDEAKKKARPWAKEFNEKVASREPSVPAPSVEAPSEELVIAPKAALVVTRSPAKLPGSLIKSLKAD